MGVCEALCDMLACKKGYTNTFWFDLTSHHFNTRTEKPKTDNVHPLTHDRPVSKESFHWNHPKPMLSTTSSTVNVSGGETRQKEQSDQGEHSEQVQQADQGEQSEQVQQADQCKQAA